MIQSRKKISFEYRCLVQAKWVQYLSAKLLLDELTVALEFAQLFAKKLDSKYVVVK